MNEIRINEKVTNLSIDNLEISSLIELIKKLNEEEKADYFNSIDKKNFIKDKDFFNHKDSKELKLLTELLEKNLIPDSIYLS